MLDDHSIWTALADSKRRHIITLLEEKPRTTGELSNYFDVSRYAVMKHLKVLEKAGLITTERQGRTRWNFLNQELALFLRTKLAANDNESYRLMDVMGLFPGQTQPAQMSITTVGPALIEQTVDLQASSAQVFEALTSGIDNWWNQRALADSQIILEPYVNGRFYEAFNANGQGILYAYVTTIIQDLEIRLQGTLEFSEHFANVSLPENFVHITLESQDNDSKLLLRNHFHGGTDKATGDICNQRWHILLNQHLKPYVEEGILFEDDP